MVSLETQILIRDRGWTYLPEHDSTTGALKMVSTVIPECWEHEKYGRVWNVGEVLEHINNEIAHETPIH